MFSSDRQGRWNVKNWVGTSLYGGHNLPPLIEKRLPT